MSRFMVKDIQGKEVVLRDVSGSDIDLCLDYRGDGQQTKIDFENAQMLAYGMLDMIPKAYRICPHCKTKGTTTDCQCWNDE